jgi:replication factor C subunit 2/4
MEINWVEKYRPKHLNDVTAQNHVIKPLMQTLKKGNLPHLIFHGPPGCGKTSTILALAKDLFGVHWKERVYEFNASDERGINVVRDKIKLYAKNYVTSNEKFKNNPEYKIIILDEADTMTNDSQFALRRIIETCSNVTRFCIVCNYINKIIEPLNSRCAKFRFKSLTDDQMVDRLKYICEQENVNYTVDILEQIQSFSNGDLRVGVNFLQKSVQLFGKKLELNLINSISSFVPINEIVNIINISKKQYYVNVIQHIKILLGKGYSAQNMVVEFSNIMKKNCELTPYQKSHIFIKIGDVYEHLNKGGDEEIQLIRMFLYFSKINSELS